MSDIQGEIEKAKHSAEAAKNLAELKQAIEVFCSPSLEYLRTGARHTVFADGCESARLMLIGEAPGRDEDAQGLPFVGISGKRLNQMLEKFGFTRASLQKTASGGQAECVYITNAVYWWPRDQNGKTRPPSAKEIDICRPFLARQIGLIQPKLIMSLGCPAASALLRCKTSMEALREKPQFYANIPVITAYHPSPLNKRNWDKYAREDFAKARGLINA